MLGTAAAAALTAKAQSPVALAAQKKKPNIVLYLADQFRWDFVGANRLNNSTNTPNLDAMAERGALFTHALTNQPVCSPSRSVMLTGRYATETGVWHNAMPIDPSLSTLAGELRRRFLANLCFTTQQGRRRDRRR
jgi:arylsulfatase A-like enzyme